MDVIIILFVVSLSVAYGAGMQDGFNDDSIAVHFGEQQLDTVNGYIDVRGDQQCIVVDGVDKACWSEEG